VIHDLPIENWKMWYADALMVGKYFELYQISNPTHVRQYSVCNTAHPSFQVNLLKLMIAKEQN
jgi:hypothetical protein